METSQFSLKGVVRDQNELGLGQKSEALIMEASQPSLKGAVRDQIESGLKSYSKVVPVEIKKKFQELNVPTQGQFFIDKSNVFQELPAKRIKLIQDLPHALIVPTPIELREAFKRWNVFRMVIPLKDESMINRYNHELKGHFGDSIVEVDFFPVAGVGVVMVSSKSDFGSFNLRARDVFIAVHQHFLYDMPPCQRCLTRLLVPAAHAKRLIISQTIKSTRCRFAVYLTDNVSVLSRGDVIVEVESERERVRDAIESIASDLGQFSIDDCMMSDLKTGNGIRLSTSKISACGKLIPSVKARRRFEVIHSTQIPLSYIDKIIGEDGENIESIRRSSAATIVLHLSTLKEVTISIIGNTTSEVTDAEKVMEGLIPKNFGEPLVFGVMDMCICEDSLENEED